MTLQVNLTTQFVQMVHELPIPNEFFILGEKLFKTK